jgi:nucleotidyltransferase substrate binding protein (TIGR01987 family)
MNDGREVALPLDALRLAYAAGWIDNEELWIGMMRDRNLTSHAYKKELALEIYGRIRAYYPEMRQAFVSIRDLHSSDR